MPRFLLAALVLGLLTGRAMAIPNPGNGPWPGEQCRAAAAAAERSHGIPAQLLSAIGRVEKAAGETPVAAPGAWPWTINAEGQGAWFDTKAEAIAAVTALRARGVRSIDVGCMQVNLMHHPEAFANLDQAFEPMTNADYAARFLLQLYGQEGDWTKATADYHSANPWEGGPYAEKVLSVWPEEQRKAGLAPAPFMPAQGARFSGPITPYPVHQPPRMLPAAATGYAAGGAIPWGRPGGMRPMTILPPIETTPPQRMMTRVVSMPPPGLRAGEIGMGVMQGPPPNHAMLPPRMMPPGMMMAGAMPGGHLMPAGMMQAGVTPSGAASPGRTLAFYRGTPVAMAAPVRLTARIPYGLTVR